MADAHRFIDEWLVRAVQDLPGVGESLLHALRERKAPCLAEALVEGGHVPLEAVQSAVRKSHRVASLESGKVAVNRLALGLFPESLCRRIRACPVRLEETSVQVAMANPLDLEAQADLSALAGRDVIPLYATPARIQALITENYEADVVVSGLVEKLGATESLEYLGPEGPERAPGADTDVRAPVVRLVNSLLAKAVMMQASDIHVEQGERGTDIRFRIDGVLRGIATVPRSVGAGPLVSRIKVMADLDVADHLKPQDGRAKVRVGGRELGLRISTLPTSLGEKVVVRLLDPQSVQKSLKDMGFGSVNVARLETLLNSAQGVIIVTGPTGAGKTTTLYALVNKLRSPDINITTVEDPVEYRLDGVNQVQVHEKQGLGFAAVLRSVLRQDPDVILVGEMRDAETASIAFQAALTGHLVLTTLHTNDSLSAVSRLLDMGVERFKLAPALLAITAQRLVRRLCPECRIPVPWEEVPGPVAEALRRLGPGAALFKPGGCPACGYTGYAGRIALMELLNVGRELRDRITAGDDAAALRAAAEEKRDLTPLLEDALWHVSRGDTSLEEIIPYVNLEAAGGLPGRAQPAPAPEAQARAPRVIVADDDPVVRSIVSTILASAGFDVREATDGRQALEMAAQAPPDLLMIDLNMPHVDGYGVIRRMREVPGLGPVPIVVLTSDNEDASQFQAIDLGADDYLIKPVKPPLVLARINAVLRRTARGGAAPGPEGNPA